MKTETKRATSEHRECTMETGMRKAIGEYVERTLIHIEFVREAGRMINLPPHVTENHDASKFSRAELIPSAMFYHSGDKPAWKDSYDRAWLHHISRNPHHWQHWIIPNVGALEMDKLQVLHMIADLLGAEQTFTGSWDMSNWLLANAGGIILHPQTARFVTEFLGDFDPMYKSVLDTSPFGVYGE